MLHRCNTLITLLYFNFKSAAGIADSQINRERHTLSKVKQSLEAQLQVVLEHLQKLNKMRVNLRAAVEQRNKAVKSVQQQIVSATSKTAVVEKYMHQSQVIKKSDEDDQISPGINVGRLIEQAIAICKHSKSIRQRSKNVMESATWVQQATFNAIENNIRQDLRNVSSAKVIVFHSCFKLGHL